MFLDTATIFVKAGNGGNGRVSFHRAKYVPAGGPDGGDGGKGGNIYFEADPSLNTLINFRYIGHYRAGNGKNGEGCNRTGKSGEDIVIKVPRGTVVKDSDTGGVLADVFHYGQRLLLFAGGRGGSGNARFCTPTRRSPAFAENGDVTTERKLKLELKTIADVGLIGFPNVGKSTLLSVISEARPKIADYHFTTITPNLGVVRHNESDFVVADIPGLIEGAAQGAGLGHAFLRHIERVRMLIHVVDISGSEERDPIEDYKIIRQELASYSQRLAQLPEIIAANKSDLLQDDQKIAELKAFSGQEIIQISAITTAGIKPLLDKVIKTLSDIPPLSQMEFVPYEYPEEDKQDYQITVENGVYTVTGGFVENLARKSYLDDSDSFNWFQRRMRDRGIIDELRQMGAKDGDTVVVMDLEFEFMD